MRLTHLYNWFQKLLRIARASVCAAAIVGVPPAFDIPMLDDIVVDGKHDDWQDQGLHVELVIPVSSDKAGDEEEEDLDVRFRLGWDERGLHLLIFVHDDVGIGSLYDHLLLEGDGVEFSVADEPSGRQIVHWSVGRPRNGDEAACAQGSTTAAPKGSSGKNMIN